LKSSGTDYEHDKSRGGRQLQIPFIPDLCQNVTCNWRYCYDDPAYQFGMFAHNGGTNTVLFAQNHKYTCHAAYVSWSAGPGSSSVTFFGTTSHLSLKRCANQIFSHFAMKVRKWTGPVEN